MKRHTLFLGGGLATASAIQAYRDAGGDDRLTLVTDEPDLPYHRPPLSKGYLRGEKERDETLVEQADDYADADVELRLETAVEGVDLDARALQLDGGWGPIEFDRLVIATGARPRELDLPGSGLDGVFTLRTLGDADAIRSAAARSRSAAVIGGSFIGTEVAASLSQLGLDVTLIHAGAELHDRLEMPSFSGHVAQLFDSHGVRVCLDSKVSALEGDGQVERAMIGEQVIDAELVVAGIGVEPAVGLLTDTDLAVDDGIVVDERFRTSIDGVYAIGDVARFRDVVADRHRRIEHWDNANAQGEHLGKLLAGAVDEPFSHVAMFFSDLFDLSFEVYGDLRGHDRTLVRGDIEDRDATVFYLRENDLVAGLLIGQEEATAERLSELIADRAQFVGDADALESAELDELFSADLSG